MGFNIKKFILEKQKNQLPQKPDHVREIIIDILQKPDIDFSYKIQGDILSFVKISPIVRTKIKLQKNLVIQKLKEKNIYIRDII
ncbi:MAG: hypothetical protein ACPGTS_01795 [Minisyncoccia bacterium]